MKNEVNMKFKKNILYCDFWAYAKSIGYEVVDLAADGSMILFSNTMIVTYKKSHIVGFKISMVTFR